MAIEIKAIPVLEGKEALRFEQKADQAIQDKGSINVKEYVESTKRILANAKLD